MNYQFYRSRRVAGGAGGVPETSLFSNSSVTQDQDGAVVLDASEEWITFGDEDGWDGLTAFTIVWRFHPSVFTGDLNFHSRWSTSPSAERQFLVRQENGSELNILLSQTGSDYAALRSPSSTFQDFDWMYGIAYDGSLGGTNGVNRVRPLRKRGTGNDWEDVEWSNTFFSGRSDVPTELNSITGIDELIPRRADGTGSGSDGNLSLMAIKYGTKYTTSQLDGMDFYNEALQEAEWDRIYHFDGNLADEVGGVHGEFTTS